MGNGLSTWRGGARHRVWLAAGVALVLLLAAGAGRALVAGADEKPVAPATVAADRGAVTTEVATTGTLEPAQTRSLSFAIGGTVENIKVRAGTEVRAGQELAAIDDSDATAAVESAQDTLDEAQDSLTEARDAASSTATVSPASCGLVPAAYPSPTRPATASPTPAPTRTSPPAVTTAPAAATATARTTASARASAAARGGPTTATDCGVAAQGQQQPDQEQAGQGTGGDAVLTAQQRVNQAGLALLNAEEQLEGTVLTAPIRGRVLAVAGTVGSQVGAGSTVITLADVFDMQISADFPEADADRLAVGQQAVVTLADRPGQNLGATVVQVDPVGTSDGTMVRYGVALSFDDAPEGLLVGQSAAVRVTTGSADGVLRVPSTAVHDVAGDTGTVLRAGTAVTVGIGLRGDQYTEITSGLTEGEPVVRSW